MNIPSAFKTSFDELDAGALLSEGMGSVEGLGCRAGCISTAVATPNVYDSASSCVRFKVIMEPLQVSFEARTFYML